jgi:hypothetical protein
MGLRVKAESCDGGIAGGLMAGQLTGWRFTGGAGQNRRLPVRYPDHQEVRRQKSRRRRQDINAGTVTIR